MLMDYFQRTKILNEKCDVQTQEIIRLQSDIASAREINFELDKDKKTLLLKVEDIEKELKSLRLQATQNQEDLELSFLRAKKIEDENNDLKIQLQGSNLKISEIKSENIEAIKTLEEFGSKLNSYETKNQELESQLSILHNKKYEYEQTIANLAEKITLLQDEKSKLFAEKVSLINISDAKNSANDQITKIEYELGMKEAACQELENLISKTVKDNELLVTQGAQLQEKLETHYLKNQELQARNDLLRRRLAFVLGMIPTWADAFKIDAKLILDTERHKSIKIAIEKLWLGSVQEIEKIDFLIGIKESKPYLELRPENGSIVKNFFEWPAEHKDEIGDRLLIAPDAPGFLGENLSRVISKFSYKNWNLITGILNLLIWQAPRVFDSSNINKQIWIGYIRQLTKQLVDLSPAGFYDIVEIVGINQSEVGEESIRIAIKNLFIKEGRFIPLIIFDFGYKYKKLKTERKITSFYMKFRDWGRKKSEIYKLIANGADKDGQFMNVEFSFDKRLKPSNPIFKKLTPGDKKLIITLVDLLPNILKSEKLDKSSLDISFKSWCENLKSTV
jgi:hypothetical protein